MSYLKRPLEELNVMDDFLFSALANDPDVGVLFCQTVLSVLLQREIGKIQITAQKTIPAVSPDRRGIRMDVVVEEATEEKEKDVPMFRIYDMEPHIRNDTNLPKRSRFYQAKNDCRYLGRGTKDFGLLPELYSITLTNFDPFGCDYMMYTIESSCVELPELEYRDGLHFIYFYTGGSKGGNKQIKELLEYIKDSRVERVTSPVLRRIHECVEEVKWKPEVEVEYMKFEELMAYAEETGWEKGMEKGRKEGMEKGRKEGMERGMEEGREEGREQAWNLLSKLLSAGRIEDVESASVDSAKRKELYEEFGLIE